MTENKRYYIGNGENCTICDSNQGGSDFYNMLTQFEAVDRLNEQEETNMQLRNQIKIFELFLDVNNLDIEWDLFCTKEDECPFYDASCQDCVYLGISGDVDD